MLETPYKEFATWVIAVEQRLAKIEAYLCELAGKYSDEWPIEWPAFPTGRASDGAASSGVEAAQAQGTSTAAQEPTSDAQA